VDNLTPALPTDISFLIELGIIAGSALALSLVAWALRLPAVLGQLIAGIIIGPFGFKLVTDLTTIGAMADHTLFHRRVTCGFSVGVVGSRKHPSSLDYRNQ
jgi:predicted Kef-type K+ transport protein